VVVSVFPLKVAVRACRELFKEKVQGEVVPVHVVVPPFWNAPVHPTKTEPTFGVTVRVPVALLLRSSLHVAVHVAGLGWGVPLTPEKAIDPPPVPANVIVKFLLS
jgi:hypothetical protein